jgi:hypothetical protein
VVSTNELVKDAIRKGEPEGLVVTALSQGAGYGRTGHHWKSPLGGLYFSILLRPNLPLEQLPNLSQVSSFAIREALGDRVGIRRVGSAYMPMDEALAFAAIDISGRPYLAWNADFTAHMCGTMDTQLAEEFFRAVTVNAGLTVHMNLIAGRNDHHKMEALFKAFGLALRDAVRVDGNIQGVLSTKGSLE